MSRCRLRPQSGRCARLVPQSALRCRNQRFGSAVIALAVFLFSPWGSGSGAIIVAVIRAKLKRGQCTAEGRAMCDQVEGFRRRHLLETWHRIASVEAKPRMLDEKCRPSMTTLVGRRLPPSSREAPPRSDVATCWRPCWIVCPSGSLSGVIHPDDDHPAVCLLGAFAALTCDHE